MQRREYMISVKNAEKEEILDAALLQKYWTMPERGKINLVYINYEGITQILRFSYYETYMKQLLKRLSCVEFRTLYREAFHDWGMRFMNTPEITGYVKYLAARYENQTVMIDENQVIVFSLPERDRAKYLFETGRALLKGAGYHG